MVHTWISANVVDDVPANVIQAGHDTDGDPIYVGRAYHNGDILPAKIIPNKKKGYVCWGGMEHEKHDVEYLVGEYYVWTPACCYSIPPTAVCAGKTSDGESLYIGRSQWCGSMTPGKIQPSHNCLYIPYGGVEQRIENNIEILIQPETWVSSSGQNIVSGAVTGAVAAGSDVDGAIIYVARAFHNGELLPAKAIPNRGCAFVSYGGEEHAKHDFELLVGHGFDWIQDSNGHVPDNALKCGHTADGEPLYIGRGNWCGSLTCGKIHPSHGCLYIPFGGQEIRIHDYEVLVRRSFN